MTSAEYNRCVDELADGVYRFVLKNIKDTEAAKDIVQDTFEKMWRLREGIDAAKAKSYLFTAAYRTLVDHTRKNRFSVLHERVPDPATEEDFGNHDLRYWIDMALGSLPDDQRAVITLRDLEGYSYQEIGEITGLSESQVKVYIYRGRAAMKKFLVSREVLV
jgi:RNA polymerase sigma-70 factor (ECF subfamily)